MLKTWVGDEKLIDRISRSIQGNAVSHAYIFEADSTVDKMSFARSFAQAILCKESVGYGCDECLTCKKIAHDNYEDLYIVSPEYNANKTVQSVRDEAIEELQNQLKKKPNLERNIAIIDNADTMTIRAQNRLLKTLEEPFEGTVIILLSENVNNLLDTIRSRAIHYHIYGDGKYDGLIAPGARELIDAVIEQKDFFTTREIIIKNVKTREDAFHILDSMEKIYRNMLFNMDSRANLVKKENISWNVALIEEARKDLAFKVNPSYALKDLAIKLK